MTTTAQKPQHKDIPSTDFTIGMVAFGVPIEQKITQQQSHVLTTLNWQDTLDNPTALQLFDMLYVLLPDAEAQRDFLEYSERLFSHQAFDHAATFIIVPDDAELKEMTQLLRDKKQTASDTASTKPAHGLDGRHQQPNPHQSQHHVSQQNENWVFYPVGIAKSAATNSQIQKELLAFANQHLNALVSALTQAGVINIDFHDVLVCHQAGNVGVFQTCEAATAHELAANLSLSADLPSTSTMQARGLKLSSVMYWITHQQGFSVGDLSTLQDAMIKTYGADDSSVFVGTAIGGEGLGASVIAVYNDA